MKVAIICLKNDDKPFFNRFSVAYFHLQTHLSDSSGWLWNRPRHRNPRAAMEPFLPMKGVASKLLTSATSHDRCKMDQLLGWYFFVLLQITHVAGIWIPTFAQHKSPSYVNIPYMEHMIVNSWLAFNCYALLPRNLLQCLRSFWWVTFRQKRGPEPCTTSLPGRCGDNTSGDETPVSMWTDVDLEISETFKWS